MKSNQTSVAIITGASRGLGRSMALHLAERGVDSIVTYHTRDDEARAVVRTIAKKGRKATSLQLDVGNAASFEAFASRVRTELARTFHRESFDFLVNNAGVGAHSAFLETSEEQFDQMVNVHLKGTFFLTQKLVGLMADGGRIVNITSGLSRFSFPGYAAYAAMKGGVEVLTRYMAKELAARGIAVNALAPGAVATDFNGGFVRDNAEMNQRIAAQVAFGRVGLPDDIGGALSVLLAPESHWITGQRIEASGGMLL